MNEIIPTLTLHPGELTAHPANSNTHSRANIEELAESRRLFDQYKNVVTWSPSEETIIEIDGQPVTLKPGIKYVIAGNGFHQASLLRQDDAIEVKDYSHLNYDEALLLMETDNASPLGSKPDPVRMKANLARARGLIVNNERMTQMLDRAKELAGISGNGTQLSAEPPEVTQIEAERLAEVYGTRLGQVWELGRHKIACVDSTDKSAVSELFGDDRADLWLTDPPYGVSYADKNAFLNTLARGNAIQKRIENDHLSMDELCDLWRNAANLAYEFTTSRAAYYWFACQGGDQMMMMMMIGEKWKVRHELIWLKNNHVLGRSDYNYKHEPILYGWKRDGTHKFYGGFQTSILEFDKPMRSELHPTTKPLPLVSKLIGNSSLPGELVYDSFLGSGTTLVACEELGRRAIGCELAPEYVAVCLHRWSSLTGREPKLITA